MENVRRAGNLAEQATQLLRQAILAGDLQPGELYTAGQLGEQIGGISRTPVREALLELSRLGLVEIEKNRGVRVITASVESLLQGFEVRLMLEVPLARRATALQDETTTTAVKTVFEHFRHVAESGDSEATLRADRDFHRSLLQGSGNTKAVILLQDQRNLVLMSGVGTVPTSRSAMECFEDHLDIFDAFMTGDVQGVGQALNRHIVNTAQMLIAQETRSRPEFGTVDAAKRLAWLMH
ncbi:MULTISPECIES: GntR family transcriptional regulator [unclassified Arthrobacter]|uniref:GntR family transcriptional regulator n=1 Tax=unclassified Arthrobacter TaxID=235627 RepID=UPI001F1B53F9|nr:GntR family transcriptional regulator [Arthrobacter sp. FW305-BF8]UKA54477.1 GntR family transcriptional regulator [Arthrobacter sp. FW305-BF8]